MRALARRETGEGLDALIAALGDGGARIAIYVLGGALRDLPEARVMPLLRAAPRERVTVFKEIVRLAGARADAAGFRSSAAGRPSRRPSRTTSTMRARRP